MQINGNELSWSSGILLVLLPTIVAKEHQKRNEINKIKLENRKQTENQQDIHLLQLQQQPTHPQDEL